MFSYPLISAVPMPGLLGGVVVVPGMAAFFALVLIAALVGSGLGMLRQLTGPHRAAAAGRAALESAALDRNDQQVHREAA